MSASVVIRPLGVDDFQFIRDLAAQQPNFTIPPPYVLWLLMRLRDGVCLVATDPESNPHAYILAVPIAEPQNALYVWQLASIGLGREGVKAILLALKSFADNAGIKTILFSATPDSTALRAITQDVWELIAVRPKATSELPAIVAPNEQEYRLDLP